MQPRSSNSSVHIETITFYLTTNVTFRLFCWECFRNPHCSYSDLVAETRLRTAENSRPFPFNFGRHIGADVCWKEKKNCLYIVKHSFFSFEWKIRQFREIRNNGVNGASKLLKLFSVIERSKDNVIHRFLFGRRRGGLKAIVFEFVDELLPTVEPLFRVQKYSLIEKCKSNINNRKKNKKREFVFK